MRTINLVDSERDGILSVSAIQVPLRIATLGL